jgi:hypothetical protein
MTSFTPRFSGDAEPKIDTVTPKVAGVHDVCVQLHAASGDIRHGRVPAVDLAALDGKLAQMMDDLVGRAPARLVADLARDAGSIEADLRGYFSGETMPIGTLLWRLAGLRQNLALYGPLLEPGGVAKPAA